MRVLVAMLPLLLLAGCTSDAPRPADDMRVAAVPEPVQNVTFQALPPPPWEDVVVEWAGNLGTRLLVCEWTLLSDCAQHDQVEGNTDYYLERSGWLRGAQLNLTWDANGRLSQELGLGLMVMGTCAGCPLELIEEVEGTSPLTIKTPYLDLALGDDRVVHAYVWNASGSRAVGSAYAYATSDQDFRVSGALAIEEAE